MRALKLVALSCLAVAAAIGACSSDESDGDEADGTSTTNGPKPCNEDPWQCPDGQTCWINATLSAFQCLNSGGGQVGAVCEPKAGEAQCADDLICLAAPGSMSGVCMPYCDPTNVEHGCPAMSQCNTYQLQDVGLQFKACTPQGGQGGAGGTGGAGGAGTGGEGTGGRGVGGAGGDGTGGVAGSSTGGAGGVGGA